MPLCGRAFRLLRESVRCGLEDAMQTIALSANAVAVLRYRVKAVWIPFLCRSYFR